MIAVKLNDKLSITYGCPNPSLCSDGGIHPTWQLSIDARPAVGSTAIAPADKPRQIVLLMQ